MAISEVDYSNLNHDEMATSIGLNVKHIPILIASFVQESNIAITKLQDAIINNDYENIHHEAHFIKGSAGNLHFNEIYEMSLEMELEATSKNVDFNYQDYLSAISRALLTIK